ncbi:hypothetical protein LINPERPRIM_LOCUS25449 [Linum perenne]
MDAMHMLHGNDIKQFERLFDYKAELERTNPGTTVEIEYDGFTFQAIYVCLDALKRGFKSGCRRVVCVDGCWLKNLKGWQLLSAVGIDGDDSVYQVAWAIVEKDLEKTGAEHSSEQVQNVRLLSTTTVIPLIGSFWMPGSCQFCRVWKK